MRIQHHTGKIVRRTEKLTVTFLAEKLPGKPNLGTSGLSLRWVQLSEMSSLSLFVLDTAIKLLVQSVHSGGTVYPASLVECLDMQGMKKRFVLHPDPF